MTRHTLKEPSPLFQIDIPVIGISARSGTGKTTFLTALIPQLVAQGVKVGVIKHTHHDFEMDQPGKDSYRLRKAGATMTLLAGHHRTAVIEEKSLDQEPDLVELVHQYGLLRKVELILVEGFRHLPFTKIEIHREHKEGLLSQENAPTWLYPEDPWIVAVVHDEEHPPPDTGIPHWSLTQVQEVANWLIDQLTLVKS